MRLPKGGLICVLGLLSTSHRSFLFCFSVFVKKNKKIKQKICVFQKKLYTLAHYLDQFSIY
jgi:hypothetical protein